jgi:hypothetical protein
MSNDEKKCPLTKMTCWGDECGLWNYGECALMTLARKSEDTGIELYTIRKELERQ